MANKLELIKLKIKYKRDIDKAAAKISSHFDIKKEINFLIMAVSNVYLLKLIFHIIYNLEIFLILNHVLRLQLNIVII